MTKKAKLLAISERRVRELREGIALAFGALIAIQPLAPSPEGIQKLIDQLQAILNDDIDRAPAVPAMPKVAVQHDGPITPPAPVVPLQLSASACNALFIESIDYRGSDTDRETDSDIRCTKERGHKGPHYHEPWKKEFR